MVTIVLLSSLLVLSLHIGSCIKEDTRSKIISIVLWLMIFCMASLFQIMPKIPFEIL